MGMLGDMVVRIKGDTGQFVQSLQSSERHTKRFVNFLIGGAGLGGIILVFRKFGQVAGDLIKEFSKQEQAEAKLRSAIQATGKQFLISASAIGQYASELQHTRAYADEETIAAAAMLQQLADLDEQGLKRLIPRVQDLAAAMDIDLASAATMVGKTVSGTSNALRKVIGDIDLTRPKSEILAEVIKRLDGKFGGMAESIGKTTSGKLEIMKNQFSSLKTELAEGFLPVANNVLSWLNDISRGMILGFRAYFLLTDKGLKAAISSYENAEAALASLNAEIVRIQETGDPDPKYLKRLQARINMIGQVIPMLKTQAEVEAAEAKAVRTALVPALKEQVYYMDWIDRLLFNYRNKQEAVTQATINARAQFDLLNRALYESGGISINAANQYALIDRTLQGAIKSSKELEEETEKLKQKYEAMAVQIVSTMGPVFETFGGLIVDQTDALGKLKQAFKDMMVAILKSIGQRLAVEAAMAFIPLPGLFNPAGGILAGLGSIAAFLAAGVVSSLQKGGFVSRATPAIIGEAGPEAVIPFNNEEMLAQLGGRIAAAMQRTAIINRIETPIQVTVVTPGGREIANYVTKASKNRQVLIDAGSIVH